MNYTIKQYDPTLLPNLKDAVTAIYQSVYTLPPYNEPPAQIESFAKSWESRTQKKGFLFVAAENKEGNLCGFTYGWTSTPGDSWNSKLTSELKEKSHFWLSDCFEFVDLAVHPSSQGTGLGRDLTNKLFSLVKAKTAILLTHQTTTKASEMYLRNGWEKLSENFEVAPGQHFQIMGKKLERK